jgi:hypothetical protein
MTKDKREKKRNKKEGSALILVLLGIIILSLLGITSLTQSTTDMVISRNFTADKTAFFTAELGINQGINELIRLSADPGSVILDYQSGDYRYRTGPLLDPYSLTTITSPQPVQGFLGGFSSPRFPGSNVELGGTGGDVLGWDLTISSFVSGFTRGINQKEIQTVIVLPAPN